MKQLSGRCESKYLYFSFTNDIDSSEYDADFFSQFIPFRFQ